MKNLSILLGLLLLPLSGLTQQPTLPGAPSVPTHPVLNRDHSVTLVPNGVKAKLAAVAATPTILIDLIGQDANGQHPKSLWHDAQDSVSVSKSDKSAQTVLMRATVSDPAGLTVATISGGYSGGTLYFQPPPAPKQTSGSVTLYFFVSYMPTGRYQFTVTASDRLGQQTVKLLQVTVTP